MTMNPPAFGGIPSRAEKARRAQQLRDDVNRYRSRIELQRLQDPDHVVALAMFEADLNRARAEFFRLTNTYI